MCQGIKARKTIEQVVETSFDRKFSRHMIKSTVRNFLKTCQTVNTAGYSVFATTFADSIAEAAVCLAHEMLPDLKTSLHAYSLEQNLDEKALLERKQSFCMDFFPEQTHKTPLSDYNSCRVKSSIS